jgi:hypothetical protein
MRAEGHGPGRIALLGSGAMSLAGGRVFESLARVHSVPLRLAVLETPAGFELTSDRLRHQIEALGWHVQDTPEGPNCTPIA